MFKFKLKVPRSFQFKFLKALAQKGMNNYIYNFIYLKIEMCYLYNNYKNITEYN